MDETEACSLYGGGAYRFNHCLSCFVRVAAEHNKKVTWPRRELMHAQLWRTLGDTHRPTAYTDSQSQGENRQQRMKGGRLVTWSDDWWSENYHDQCPWAECLITAQRNYAIILTPSAVHYCRRGTAQRHVVCPEQTERNTTLSSMSVRPSKSIFHPWLDLSAAETNK